MASYVKDKKEILNTVVTCIGHIICRVSLND